MPRRRHRRLLDAGWCIRPPQFRRAVAGTADAGPWPATTGSPGCVWPHRYGGGLRPKLDRRFLTPDPSLGVEQEPSRIPLPFVFVTDVNDVAADGHAALNGSERSLGLGGAKSLIVAMG